MTSNLIKFKKYELQYYPCDSTRHQNDNYMITTNENFTNKNEQYHLLYSRLLPTSTKTSIKTLK
jgi:hypothetical protein